MAHRQAAQVFFEGAVGAILVHDLTNKRSEENLATWLTMLDGKPRGAAPKSSKDPAAVALKVDIESCNIPVLIVGTKADLVPHKGPVSYDRYDGLGNANSAISVWKPRNRRKNSKKPMKIGRKLVVEKEKVKKFGRQYLRRGLGFSFSSARWHKEMTEARNVQKSMKMVIFRLFSMGGRN